MRTDESEPRASCPTSLRSHVTSRRAERSYAVNVLGLQRASASDTEALILMIEASHALERISVPAVQLERALSPLLLSDALGGVWLLVDGDATVGYVVLTWSYDLEWAGREAFLTDLFIDAGARGRRLGTAAMPLIEAVARAHGARALHLMVRHDNNVAQRLYANAGFTVPPRLFMTKPLGD